VGDASHINRPLAAPGCHGLIVGRHDVYRRRDPAAAPRVSWSAEQGCGDIVRLHARDLVSHRRTIALSSALRSTATVRPHRLLASGKHTISGRAIT
jgi:hypothetical protein